MVHMSIIQLSDDQKRKLLELAASASELLTHRARLILAYAEGKPTMHAAMEAGISRGRARFWKRQFLLKGLGIFNLEATDVFAGGQPTSSIDILDEGMREVSPAFNAKENISSIQVEIPYPEPLQSIGVSPDDSLAQAGRKVWLYHFALMLNHEEGTLFGGDIEELHDMRVATRRMRTAFDIFGPAFTPKIMKRFLKGLRTTGSVLGEVRDMDVLLENAINYQGNMKERKAPGLEPLLSEWKQMIDKKRSKMTKHLQSEAYHTFKYNFNLFLQAPENITEPASLNNGTNSHIRDIVPILVYSRYATVRAYDAILPSASVTQLHALRIEFKKFRYLLEYFKEILGENAGQAITELKQLQDHLGGLHDADVACQLVRDFLKDWEEDQLGKPITERVNPEPTVTYLAFLHAERYRLTISFPELWRKFSRPEFRQIIAQAISLL
jgi:CHAD domain-containing protein